MKRHPKIDLSKVKTYSISSLARKVEAGSLGQVFTPGLEFELYIKALPNLLKAGELKELVNFWAEAALSGKKSLLMMGAHPIKAGLSPIIIDLIENGFITGVAGNGAVAIHDCEMARIGRTSEEVIEGLEDGTFGMARETGEFINGAAIVAAEEDAGFGEALGEMLEKENPAYRELSIILACRRKEIPFTAHVALGTDIVHQQPSCDGGAVGTATFNDFKILAHQVAQLSEGVVVNLGSAVVMPEVFLKALTVTRNLGAEVKRFAAANFDMIQHYRPNTNVLQRPALTGEGKAFTFTGHHELMLPLLAAMLKSRLNQDY